MSLKATKLISSQLLAIRARTEIRNSERTAIGRKKLEYATHLVDLVGHKGREGMTFEIEFPDEFLRFLEQCSGRLSREEVPNDEVTIPFELELLIGRKGAHDIAGDQERKLKMQIVVLCVRRRMVNHYETLGVSPDCTVRSPLLSVTYSSLIASKKKTTELKKAFHALSLQTHPDRPGGSTASFQLVQEAYDVLSDSNGRAIHDESLQEPTPGFGFDMFGRGGGGRQQQQRAPPKRKSRSSNVEISITLEELFKGKEKNLSIQRDRCCVICTG